ncbi:MAG: phosphatidate cytidylyltransferase [Dehalococcoidales bacterium]|nr:phosphatidate cytidylyltransferase [Dehalococcoidales bacterium]
MLKNRIITAIWALPVLGVIIWFGEPYFTILFAIIGLLAVLEFYKLSRAIKAAPLTVFGGIWTLLFIAVRNPKLQSLIEPYVSFDLLIPLLITSGIAVSLIVLLTRRQKQSAFNDWAWTFAGILYVGWLLSYLVTLRGLNDGRSWVFLALFVTFGSDTAAYFVGRTTGKHKLAPAISPKKTWEGAIGGLLGAVIISLCFLLPTPVQLSAYLNWWQAVILGLLVSIFSQLGDLVESLLKRNAGAKDSGKLFPGHGGALDRLDSIVFAVVVVYYWVLYVHSRLGS